ncbi:MAG TPA: alpha/beta fold hydrolase [Blastocatellia bacterium]|nr:alpha/beta fold hydrolase [Blastocatellia bacterium]
MTVNLFCFPFAGGNAHSYQELAAHLPESIRMVPVELPGRGRRADERLRKNLMELVDDLLPQVSDRGPEPYALFGHSMGASLAHELTRRLTDRRAGGIAPPVHLFVSGRQAPIVPPKHRRWDLPRSEFLNMLRRLGGCPPELLEDDELMEFFEPILRADFEAVESHVAGPAAPFETPITVLIGDRDEVTPEEADHWQQETTHPITVSRLTGGHFFLFDHWARVAALITSKILPLRSKAKKV